MSQLLKPKNIVHNITLTIPTILLLYSIRVIRPVAVEEAERVVHELVEALSHAGHSGL